MTSRRVMRLEHGGGECGLAIKRAMAVVGGGGRQDARVGAWQAGGRAERRLRAGLTPRGRGSSGGGDARPGCRFASR